MVDFAPQLMFQVMHDRSGRSDRRGHLRATESIERFGLEMFAQSEAVVFQRVVDLTDVRFLLRAD